jgi:hypothetical protein
VAAADGKFMMAIYDHKVNNYECCPTFSFDIGKESGLEVNPSLYAVVA